MNDTERILSRALDPQVFAFETGYSFRGLTVSTRGGEYNIVLRAYDRSGTAIYAMTVHQHPLEGLVALLGAVSDRGGEALWRKDNYVVG